MKKMLLLLPCYLLAASYCFGQWVQQNSTTTASLNDIYCVSADTCYVAGNGTLLKTTDGGAIWFLQNSGISGGEPLQAIICWDENICVTVGNDTYRTIDGGNSWMIITQPMGGIASFFLFNDSIGYAAGNGGIIKTTDTGDTWNWVGSMIGLNGATAMHFSDENIGYATDYIFPDGIIKKTTDGGDFWTQMYVEPGILLSDMVFPNDSVGFAVGQTGTIIKTTDYGNSWTVLSSGVGNVFYAIDCIDEDTCYVAGTQSIVLKTTDGGTNWQLDTTGITTTVAWNGIHFPKATVGYVVGAGGKIFKRGSTTSVIEFTNEQASVNIFPNPTTGKFTLQGATGEIQVYDLFGRLLLRSNKHEIDMSNYPAGLYIWQVGEARGKVIIE